MWVIFTVLINHCVMYKSGCCNFFQCCTAYKCVLYSLFVFAVLITGVCKGNKSKFNHFKRMQFYSSLYREGSVNDMS